MVKAHESHSNAKPAVAAIALAVAGIASSCAPLEYDLSSISLPISAKPFEGEATEVVPLHIESRNTLWVHGLAGHSTPDIAALVIEASEGYDRIADFRVKQTAGFEHWLATHLSLTMMRIKKVVIEGQLIRD